MSSILNQEDHGFYSWGNWSSGTGCSPLVGISWEPRALPLGLHYPLNHFTIVPYEVNPSTPRHKCRACSGLTLSGAFRPRLKRRGLRRELSRTLGAVERVNYLIYAKAHFYLSQSGYPLQIFRDRSFLFKWRSIKFELLYKTILLYICNKILQETIRLYDGSSNPYLKIPEGGFFMETADHADSGGSCLSVGVFHARAEIPRQHPER